MPYFNGFVYLENKTKIGKVDEIFGPTTDVMFSVKTDEGVVASSFKKKDVVYISPDKLLPMSRFTNEKKGRSGGRGGGRGGRGAVVVVVEVVEVVAAARRARRARWARGSWRTRWARARARRGGRKILSCSPFRAARLCSPLKRKVNRKNNPPDLSTSTSALDLKSLKRE